MDLFHPLCVEVESAFESSFVALPQIGCTRSTKGVWELAHKHLGEALFARKKPPRFCANTKGMDLFHPLCVEVESAFESSFVALPQIGCIRSTKGVWELAHKHLGEALFARKKPPRFCANAKGMDLFHPLCVEVDSAFESSFVALPQIGCIRSTKGVWELAHKHLGEALFACKKPPRFCANGNLKRTPLFEFRFLSFLRGVSFSI